MNRPLILCIDDDIHILEALQRDLRQTFDIALATNFADAQKAFAQKVQLAARY